MIALGVFPNPLLRSIREPVDLARTAAAPAYVAETPATAPTPDRVTLAD